jgi:DnaJ-class molecular chaperone
MLFNERVGVLTDTAPTLLRFLPRNMPMAEKDYYKVLGVERDADPRRIKEAYRKNAFEYHPDRNKGNAEALEKMKELNEAYAVLSDPAKRIRYDSLRQEYGSNAYDRFRQGYSEEDIFRGSDINQVFEEMARNFGFRRFDDLFSEFYGKGYQTFEFRRPGVFGKGFIFFGFPRTGQDRNRVSPKPAPLPGLFGKLAGYLLKKTLGAQQSDREVDRHDMITIDEEEARQGARVSYVDHATQKQLIIKIPKGVKEGQAIRLRGVVQEGSGGGAGGDLYLKVRFRKNLFERFRALLQKRTDIKEIDRGD